jgi:hypothetical protein
MMKILPNIKTAFTFLFVTAFSCFSFSQRVNNDFIISVDTHIGTILAPPRLNNVIKGHPIGVEVNYIRPTHGEKRWQRIYHYPEMGLTFIYFDFANPEQLGKGISLYPFINFHLTHGKIFSLEFKMATCIGYVTKKFDPVNNPDDLVIGSHFNAFVSLRWNAKIRLSDNLNLKTGFGLTHFSNGAMDLPNFGMNVASFDLGIAYHFNSENVKLLPDTFTASDHHLHLVTYVCGGICEISRTSQKEYPAGVVSVNLERYYGSRTKWNAGLEFEYSSARLEQTRTDTSIHNYKDVENLQVGIKAGYAFVVDQLSFPVEMGVYLYSHPNTGYFFHRIGVRYQVNKHLIACITLKTQWAAADYFEFGFGYTFPIKKNN